MSEATTNARAVLTTVLDKLKAAGFVPIKVDVCDPDHYGYTPVEGTEQTVEVASSAATEDGAEVYVAHVDAPTEWVSRLNYYPYEDSVRDVLGSWEIPSEYGPAGRHAGAFEDAVDLAFVEHGVGR